MPNFCPKCGTPCSGANFCSNCGHNLQSTVEHTAPVPKTVEESFDFETLAAEAAQTAFAISLSSFNVEEHSNGKYAILSLKSKNELCMTVPDCVESIADGAFEGCAAFEITLPEGLMLIGKRAFADAKNLEKINIPSSVRFIDDEAFAGCEQLDIVIPEKVRQGNYVIKDTLPWKKRVSAKFDVTNGVLTRYKSLETETVIGNGIVEIGVDAFRGNHIIQKVTISYGVTSIQSHAFHGCSNLRSITFSNDITNIGLNAFCDCTGLVNLEFPTSLRNIGYGAFYRCSSLTSVTISYGLTTIDAHAFGLCSGLTSLNIPNTVTSIGDSAFYGCFNLKSITLPRRFESQLSKIGIDTSRTRVTYT